MTGSGWKGLDEAGIAMAITVFCFKTGKTRVMDSEGCDVTNMQVYFSGYSW